MAPASSGGAGTGTYRTKPAVRQIFLDGTKQLATDTTSPYSITWNTNNVTKGTHTLTAVATDAAGNSTVSAAVTVTIK